jgi:hypothetical protein
MTRHQPSDFAVWATIFIYVGLPALFVCAGLSVLVWLYGFH